MEETCLIFHIQKFSLHDGPGIRTVVFLKGCPLRCQWCANPESQSSKIQVLWDRVKCQSCGVCQRTCPKGALVQGAGGVKVNHPTCDGCGLCAHHCPANALSMEGEYKKIGDILQLCLQDLPFYEESGGGVTLSGGEPLMQPDCSIALLQALKENKIHTALETTGFASPEVFDRVCAHADLLLFDMKHWKEARHKIGTGVSNLPILHNLRRAIAKGKNVLPRVPVIPGFNDTLQDAKKFAQLLRQMGATQVQLLPFHQFGERKYEMMGMDYAYQNVEALHPEDLSTFQHVFFHHGIDAFF